MSLSEYGYNYDAANRMSSFAINGVIQAEYDYNALGQQVIRRLTQAGQTIHSIHDRDGNRIAEYDYDETAGTSSLIREYIWANGTVVGVYENGTLYFVRTDHIGRPVFATDGVGTKVWEASYLPFGGVQASSGPNPALRFPGQWFQSETGLHQNWMRDYDPTTGRYIQADPLGLVDGASVYGYVRQNPGRYVDPRGEQSTTTIYPGESGSDLLPNTGQSPGLNGVGSGASITARIAALTLTLAVTPTAMGNGEALPLNCGADQCLEHYKACTLSRLGGFPGSVYGESRCQTCYNACRGTGVWPSSVPSARNGALTCRYWPRRRG